MRWCWRCRRRRRNRQPSAAISCFCDNEKLARYLVSDFVSHFGAWKNTPALRGLVYRPLDSVEVSGDAGKHLQRDRQGRRPDHQAHLERPRQAVLLRAAAGQVRDRQAHDAEPVRPLRRRHRDGERQAVARQTGAARNGGPLLLAPRCWRSPKRGSAPEHAGLPRADRAAGKRDRAAGRSRRSAAARSRSAPRSRSARVARCWPPCCSA